MHVRMYTIHVHVHLCMCTSSCPPGDGGDLSQSITELKSIVLAHSKQMADFSHEVRGQLAIINATVSSLQGQLESLAGEVVKNRQRTNVVNRRMETVKAEQLQIVHTADNISTGVDCIKQSISELNSRVERVELEQVNTSLQQANATDQLSTGLSQLRTELTANQQMVERISSQQLRIQNEATAQLQIVHTTLNTQLANATDQLSTGLNQLRRQLTDNQRIINLAHNRIETQLGAQSLSLQQQCRQTSLEALQDSLAAHTSQLATATDQLSTGHQALEDGLTEQLQTVSSDCGNRTAELLQGQQTALKTLRGIDERIPYSCGGSPGWRRVAFLNMTDTNQDCPSGWSLTTHSVRTCGRASSGWYTCDQVTFPVSGGEYSRVCGRIRAYQYGYAWAFRGALSPIFRLSLNGSYVDGISVTHGAPRQHIWTFAAGLAREHCCSLALYQYCYCDVQSHPRSYQDLLPSFVGNDYFCESGVSGPRERNIRLYSENPLWDGQNCGQNSTCCSMNNPPYFMKALPAPTTDDIEVRLCSNNYRQSEYPVELLEIYVQ